VKRIIELLQDVHNEICEVAYEYCERQPHYFDKLKKAMDFLEEEVI
jgi:hypothetical protein